MSAREYAIAVLENNLRSYQNSITHNKYMLSNLKRDVARLKNTIIEDEAYVASIEAAITELGSK